jgi:transcriptional regulator with XRE-family HTH domain
MYLHLILTEERVMSTQVLMEVDGEKLRRLRKRRVWLIGDLAERSGVHRNVISKLENGRGGAYPETIRKLAGALGVDPAELVEGE